jgi:prepilin-type N-terminal cleavage/methylation domain-containing protein
MIAAARRSSPSINLRTETTAVPHLRVLCQAGVTLVEMLVVVAILALTAGIALPTSDVLDTVHSNAGASEVTQAIRFAQREAIRTSAWHTVKLDPAAQTLRVFRLTASGAEDSGNPVLHPIDKKKYDVAFGASGPTHATITLVDFDYEGAGNANLPFVSFGPDGTPALMTGPGGKDIKPMKVGLVGIKSPSGQRTLAVDIVTGRVSG